MEVSVANENREVMYWPDDPLGRREVFDTNCVLDRSTAEGDMEVSVVYENREVVCWPDDLLERWSGTETEACSSRRAGSGCVTEDEISPTLISPALIALRCLLAVE